ESPMRPPLWWRLSANYPIRLASSCCRAVGWSSGFLPGSIATGASPRTSRLPSPPPRLSSMRLASCCSPGGWLVGLEIRVGLLQLQRQRAAVFRQDHGFHGRSALSPGPCAWLDWRRQEDAVYRRQSLDRACCAVG